MRHCFLIVALGEIFYGVVSAQNSLNYGPNRDYGNFPQSYPQNGNQQPNGLQPDDDGMGSQNKGDFGQRRRNFQQPSSMNGYHYPTDQSQNQNFDPSDPGNDYSGQDKYSQGNNPQAYNGNFDTGQNDNSQGNEALQSNYNQNLQPDAYDTGTPTNGKKKKRRRRKRPPGSPPLRKRRRRRRKGSKDTPPMDNPDNNLKESLPDEDQIPPGIPNDYPGYTYPPDFFSDLLEGLDDSSGKSGSSQRTNQGDNADEIKPSESTNYDEKNEDDDDDVVPDDIPNDYPGFSYPPDFFSDLFEGLEDSSSPTVTEDPIYNNNGGEVNTESSPEDSRTIETTTIIRKLRKRKRRPPGSRRRRLRRKRLRGNSTPSNEGDNDLWNGGQPSSNQISHDYSYATPGYDNMTEVLGGISSVDSGNDTSPQRGNADQRHKKPSDFNMDDFLKNFWNTLQGGNHSILHKPRRHHKGNISDPQNLSTIEDEDRSNISPTENYETETYSNGTRYIVTDPSRYRIRKNRKHRRKKLRRKLNNLTDSGVPPGIPNDYPDFPFPPGFFDDLLDGLNVSSPFDNDGAPTKDYGGEETQVEDPTGDIYETSTSGEMQYLPPDQVNDFTLIEPPPGVDCHANESYYRCVPHCKHTCFNYDSDEKCPVFCQPGCGCNRGLLINEKGECVHPDDCFELSCGLDEEWWDCRPTCHNTCKNFARAEACEDVECDSGCFCRDGLILDSDGTCVEPEECADPTCQENEEETDCMSPCNTCAANCHSCQFRACREGCDCKDGFKRDSKGECIHASLCPPCILPNSTMAPSTPGG